MEQVLQKKNQISCFREVGMEQVIKKKNQISCFRGVGMEQVLQKKFMGDFEIKLTSGGTFAPFAGDSVGASAEWADWVVCAGAAAIVEPGCPVTFTVTGTAPWTCACS